MNAEERFLFVSVRSQHRASLFVERFIYPDAQSMRMAVALKVFAVVLVLCIVLGCESPSMPAQSSKGGCSSDKDCAPASCCHPDSCVPAVSGPECAGVLCTMDCRPGTMDCGAGRCVCQAGACKAVIQGSGV